MDRESVGWDWGWEFKTSFKRSSLLSYEKKILITNNRSFPIIDR